MSKAFAVAALLAAAVMPFCGPARAELFFRSTQLRAIAEAQTVRDLILKDFPEAVDFIPEETGPFLDCISAEAIREATGERKRGLTAGPFSRRTASSRPVSSRP